MTRNTQKYVYITIGMLRNGPTHQALVADAEAHNTKHLPTIANIRLSQFYELRQSGLLGAFVLPSSSDANSVQEQEDTVTANAQAALDAWPE